MKRIAPDNDVVIVEIGGTVGDIESLPFLEAIRQFRQEVGRDNALFIHLTLVPFIAAAGEVKTKPTQHSVRELMEIGIQPDILICRTERPLSEDTKRKIALFCNVEFGAVIESRDVPTIYQIPLVVPRAGDGCPRRAAAESRDARPGPLRLARHGAADHRAPDPGADRGRRQIHGVRRQLQECPGSADPRRHRQRCRCRHLVGGERHVHRCHDGAHDAGRVRWLARAGRVRRARRRWHGRGDPRRHARQASRSWGSASACRSPSSSSRATC